MNFKHRLRNNGCSDNDTIDQILDLIIFFITIYFIDTVNNQWIDIIFTDL